MTGLLSPTHMVVVLIVLLLVFGAKRLPELGRSLGRGMREFRTSISTDPDDQQATLPATASGTRDQAATAARPVSEPAIAETQTPRSAA